MRSTRFHWPKNCRTWTSKTSSIPRTSAPTATPPQPGSTASLRQRSCILTCSSRREEALILMLWTDHVHACTAASSDLQTRRQRVEKDFHIGGGGSFAHQSDAPDFPFQRAEAGAD